MKDRIPGEGKAGRMLITPESGAPFYATVTMADEPLDEGTPLNKANLLQDETAAMYGRDQNATVDNILTDIGIYMQYWWKARSVEGHYEAVFGAAVTANLTGGPGASTYTLSYSSSYELNQTTGEVALVNPTVIEMVYTEDVSATLRGKYFSTSNVPGKIFSAGSDAVFNSSYEREDGVSFYSATLTNCSQITSKYVEFIGDYYFLRSNDRDAHPDSGIVGGIEYQFLGKPFDNAVAASKIEIGSYTGTGEYGSSNRTVLTFSAPPKVVFLSLESGNSASSPAPLVLIRGHKQGYTPTSGSSYGGYVYVTWSGNTVSLYDNNGAAGQFNSGNVVYAAIL